MQSLTYLIDEEVIFKEADFSMTRRSNPNEIIVLTATPGRVLTHLLKNNGTIVSREELFNAVWEEHGLQASGNSLTQSISLLRKNLSEFGCDESIITTITKSGFTIPSTRTTVIGNEIKKKKTYLATIYILSAQLIIASISILYALTPREIPSEEVHQFSLNGTCEAYWIGNPPLNPKLNMKTIESQIKNHNLICSENHGYYMIQGDKAFYFKNKGRLIISLCSSLKGLGCESVYEGAVNVERK